MALTPDEIHFLIAHNEEITAEFSTDTTWAETAKLGIADVEKLRDRFGSYGRAVAELIQSRRTTQGKLPSNWLMCMESAQQSTPPVVAAERMRRISNAGFKELIDVTCSIGTEGHAAVAAGLEYIGADLDFSRLLMARINVDGAKGWLRADALSPAVGGDRVVIADPARRSGGRRITDPAQLQPPLPSLLKVWTGQEMAVKCAPGLDFSFWDGTVSVVSVDGGVKEACLYTPKLAAGEQREAVIIRGNEVRDRITDLNDSAPDSSLIGPPGTFIIDPDGAIVRAGLVRHWAVREGLWMLDERIAHLTGDRIPEGTSGFSFMEQVPLKRVKSVLAAHDAGSVEILVRGVDVDPDQLRKKWKLKGSRQMAVVITRIGSAGVALVCGPREWADGR